jgi:hypothetical protein
MTDEEDIQILTALRDYRPPQKLHKIAMFAWALYEDAERSLPPEAIDALRSDLAAYQDLKDLTDALCGLSAFVIYVTEHLGDPETGEQVGELIKEMSPRYASLTDRVVFALENLSKKAKFAFDKFTAKDQAEEKRAPVHDENPPEGTFPAKNLKPVAKPPPWARKK